jgi:hypothetical protein
MTPRPPKPPRLIDGVSEIPTKYLEFRGEMRQANRAGFAACGDGRFALVLGLPDSSAVFMPQSPDDLRKLKQGVEMVLRTNGYPVLTDAAESERLIADLQRVNAELRQTNEELAQELVRTGLERNQLDVQLKAALADRQG